MTMQNNTELRIPQWSFGDKIRKARAQVGMDQREFAEAIGLTSSTIAAYETGRANPRFKDVGELAKKLERVTSIPRTWFVDFNSATSDYKSASSVVLHADFTGKSRPSTRSGQTHPGSRAA